MWKCSTNVRLILEVNGNAIMCMHTGAISSGTSALYLKTGKGGLFTLLQVTEGSNSISLVDILASVFII